MNNNYEVFWEPTEAFEKVFSDLKKATKSIHIETFKFSNDVVGKELIKILIEKSKTIPVQMIVDGYGLENFKNNFAKKIKESNIEFIVFNNIWQHIKEFKIRKWFRSLPYRSHRKLTIIDEEIAYVGGLNYHSNEIKWHDLFVRIKGPIIKQLISCAKEMKLIAVRKKTEVRKINKKNNKIYQHTDCITRQIPLSRQRPLKKQLRLMINSAKKEVCFSTPYFITDPQFHNILRRAVKRGIEVKLIVPERSDRGIADILRNTNLFIAQKEGIQIRLFPKMTHAKYLICDEDISTFGSANMDYQAFYNNFELNITSKNKELTKDLKKEFNKNWNESKPFQVNKWLERSSWDKLKEKILHPFRKYF